jgi:DNA-binding response OmpR family regulator
VARIALLSPDLLFGSKVQGALELAGHSVSRFATADRLRVGAQFHDLVIFDLTAEEVDGPALLRSLRERGELETVPTLGYYSHVDAETRARALEAGFTRVVPRSRMAREGAALVEALLAEGYGQKPAW